MADLGNGVMDEAFVEAAAFVLKTINDNFLKNNKKKRTNL